MEPILIKKAVICIKAEPIPIEKVVEKNNVRRRYDNEGAVEWITEPILRNVRVRRGPMQGTLKDHLNRIRPDPIANRRI